eukprot:549967_1
MEYIQSNFKFWNDVANDPNWQNTVNLYLKNLKCDILKQLYQPQMPSLANVSVETVNKQVDRQQHLLHSQSNAIHRLQNENAKQREQIEVMDQKLSESTNTNQSQKGVITSLRKEKRNIQKKNYRQQTRIKSLQKRTILSCRTNVITPKVGKYRVNAMLAKTEHLTSKETQSKIWTECVHSKYPSYHKRKEKQRVK